MDVPSPDMDDLLDCAVVEGRRNDDYGPRRRRQLPANAAAGVPLRIVAIALRG